MLKIVHLYNYGMYIWLYKYMYVNVSDLSKEFAHKEVFEDLVRNLNCLCDGRCWIWKVQKGYQSKILPNTDKEKRIRNAFVCCRGVAHTNDDGFSWYGNSINTTCNYPLSISLRADETAQARLWYFNSTVSLKRTSTLMKKDSSDMEPKRKSSNEITN